MTYVALDRRFVSWDEDAGSAAERLSTAWLQNDIDWTQLGQHKRVVLLAEAGSGKSAELWERTRAVTADGALGLYSQVKEVARDGLAGSWSAADQERFAAWKKTDLPGWFFVDSVDEAKLDHIQLDTALRKMADALGADLRRAHIVLAGRITDWEFRVDRAWFAKLLPVPPTPDLPEAPPVLVRALRGEYRSKSRKTPKSAEPVRVVLMAALDEPRVRLFAAGFGIPDTDPFIRALQEGDLWFLARRPFDLGWLVEYWRRHCCFGSLTEMIEASLGERLRERNPQHAREDPIDLARAWEALERIGAAMVFARTDKIALEDSALSLVAAPGALRLEEVLPDWPPAHRRRLLSRAVFDPATSNCVRLHNDNEGTVRAFLAARWLRRRRDAQGSVRPLLSLLFCEIYGYALVRPCARQTSAWLALWDETVARKVNEREPDLLLQFGDPGSLPVSVRVGTLTRVIEEMAGTDEHFGYLPEEPLRRLASPDLAASLRALWAAHRAHESCCQLLLRIIKLGRIAACTDLAQAALASAGYDEVTTVLAVRALVATADPAAIAAYATRIRADAEMLPALVVWEAIDELFPVYLSVEDFLSIVGRMDVGTRTGYPGLDSFGPRCAERLKSRAELERLLTGVLALLAGRGDEDEEADRSPGSQLKLLSALAESLMRYVAPTEAPDSVIDVALRIRVVNRHRTHDESSRALFDSLCHTREQRRIVFWHVARAWAYPKMLQGRPLTRVWEMSALGWPSLLQIEDLEWLLADARVAAVPQEAHLALDAAMELWRRDGQREAVLERIRSGAPGVSELAQVLHAWLTPPTPSPFEVEHQKEMAALKAGHLERERKRDESWGDFVEHLKSDPDQLRRLPAPTPDSVDARLYHLWQLLSSLDARDTRFAIDDLRPLEAIVGVEVTAAFRDALLKFWRLWQPTLESTRPANQRNQISNFDCIGLCAVSVEARLHSGWPGYLNPGEARRAAQFATVELNGFPPWTVRLASAWPAEVGEVLAREAIAEMTDNSESPFAGPLQDLESGPIELCRAVAVPLFDALRQRGALTERILSQVLTILRRGLPRESAGFLAFTLKRASEAADPRLAAAYLAAVFYREPEAGLDSLQRRLALLAPPERGVLIESLLPRLVGDLYRGRSHELPALSLTVLEALVTIAYENVLVSEDVARESGVVYSPGARDAAEHARDGLLRQLTQVPGLATLKALRRIAAGGATPVSGERFEAWCRERAALDADGEPWTARAAYEHERNAAAAERPRSSAELKALARSRLDELAHELRHGDFTRGTLLQALPDENGVQRFIAHELRARQGQAYTLEREPHVADENEPDIRLQARSSEARLPIEIKDTASGWTLKELEKGLIEQLCGRYMRDAGDRHGIYLLVHRASRTWRNARGTRVDFKVLVKHLQAIANRRARKALHAPQVEVFSIDVSDLASRSVRRAGRLKRPLKKAGRRKTKRKSQ